MTKKKVCKQCRLFVEGDACPLCKGTDFSTNWQGRVSVINPEKSRVAHEVGYAVQGEYAIKVR